MFKAQPTVLSAAQFLQKSQTEISNKPAFKKELQVYKSKNKVKLYDKKRDFFIKYLTPFKPSLTACR